ncbi:MAG: hypothetical protein ACM3SY_06025 [Candidatus Omnitrophota bacterium]
MSNSERSRKELTEVMKFLGSLSSGIEEIVGEAACGMSYVAGKELGKKYSEGSPKTNDILEAIKISQDILAKNGFLWKFEPWKKKNQDSPVFMKINEYTDKENEAIQVVFRDCMIRQTLFCYGHDQKQSLCYMMYGFFSGAMESIMGRKATLEIKHAGPNACLKELTLGDPV